MSEASAVDAGLGAFPACRPSAQDGEWEALPTAPLRVCRASLVRR